MQACISTVRIAYAKKNDTHESDVTDEALLQNTAEFMSIEDRLVSVPVHIFKDIKRVAPVACAAPPIGKKRVRVVWPKLHFISASCSHGTERKIKS
jgi:hypothetical protein